MLEIFVEKNPISHTRVNFARYRKQVQELRAEFSTNPSSAEKKFLRILHKFRKLIRNEVVPDIYFIVGAHGGVIIDDQGFCEFDSPRYALQKLVEKMELAIACDAPFEIEVAPSCLEWVASRFPEDLDHFRTTFKRGRFEFINPTYSQPYGMIIGAESNLKQFELGLKVLQDLDIPCHIHYYSEVCAHPQIPQILRGFGIDLCSLRTRLLGVCPATPSGFIDWRGLDGTTIPTLTDQPGIFNGEYWHGTFFREIPQVLFQAVARPYMKHLFFSTIEDFIMPMECQEAVWRVSKFVDVFGGFSSVTELARKIPRDGEIAFPRDLFYLGEYIFNPHELFLATKQTEAAILAWEALNALVPSDLNASHENGIEQAWKNLLLAQAHDNYAVPFTRTGDYSVNQMGPEEYSRLGITHGKTAIVDVSLNLLEKTRRQCVAQIRDVLSGFVPAPDENLFGSIVVFNPSAFDRKNFVTVPLKQRTLPESFVLRQGHEIIPHVIDPDEGTIGFQVTLPAFSIRVYSLFLEKIREDLDEPTGNSQIEFPFQISELPSSDGLSFKKIGGKSFWLKFNAVETLEFVNLKHIRNPSFELWAFAWRVGDEDGFLTVRQDVGFPRVEFIFDTPGTCVKDILIIPDGSLNQMWTTYPFGVEETTRSTIQSLDFLAVGINDCPSLVVLVGNSQRFKISRSPVQIENTLHGKGRYEFAIQIQDCPDFSSTYFASECYHHPLLGIFFKNDDHIGPNPDNLEFHKLHVNGPAILTRFWSQDGNHYVRLFNPSKSQISVGLEGEFIRGIVSRVDFLLNEVDSLPPDNISLQPWAIMTIRLH